MQTKRRILLAFATIATIFSGTVLTASAQSAPRLYDPQPPADSAYVRVILASGQGPVDVAVDGRMRIRKLVTGDASDYMVIPHGPHTIALHLAGKPTAQVTTTFDAVRGRAISLAFTTLKPDSVPFVFEDKANSNKLKAGLTVYHLDSGSGDFNVLTPDKNTKVFSDIAFGTTSTKQVNPISVELVAIPSDAKNAGVKASVSMSPGGTYSLLLLPAQGASSRVKIIQNQIERYTGP